MQNVKGTYDFVGKEQAIRQKVQSVLREVFELYDFEGMDTTILNDMDLLTSKYAGGDEILKEMYRLTDQGQRELGLRYDLTIPFAKVVAMHPGIEFPFKRYEIGKVFRDGPVKRGRLREFMQCDADVVGTAGPEAEAELMLMAKEVFGRLGIPAVLRWNNRRFLSELLASMGVLPTDLTSVMLTLDKLDKIGRSGVIHELVNKGIDGKVTEALLGWIETNERSFIQLASAYGLESSKGYLEALALQQFIDKLGLNAFCIFDPFLSRGLSFYTGTVYEMFDAESQFPSSLGSGGRYDAIIGKLIGREDMAYPAVGISFGMESIMELLRGKSMPTPAPAVVIIPVGDTAAAALRTASVLRSNGIRTRVDFGKRKLKKSLASIASKDVPFAVIIGEEEIQSGHIRCKNMREMSESLISIDDAIRLILQSGGAN